ncbi:hypothetical protein GFS60_07269 (plasmid) [Rhodococcus sp. WAY2]|nr:hypothetical protein GFS60_07269 [Rhodococcus sp. WAY2]
MTTAHPRDSRVAIITDSDAAFDVTAPRPAVSAYDGAHRDPRLSSAV